MSFALLIPIMLRYCVATRDRDKLVEVLVVHGLLQHVRYKVGCPTLRTRAGQTNTRVIVSTHTRYMNYFHLAGWATCVHKWFDAWDSGTSIYTGCEYLFDYI